MSKQSAKQKWLANSCLHAATSLWRRWNKLQHFCSEGVWLDHCALNILVLYSPLYVSLQPTEPPAFLSDRRPALPLRKPAISLRPVLPTSALRRSTAHCHKREASTCMSATTAWQPALSNWGGSSIAHSVKSAPQVLVPLGWVDGMQTREETDLLTQDVHVLWGKHSVLLGVACLRLNGCEPVSWISVSFSPHYLSFLLITVLITKLQMIGEHYCKLSYLFSVHIWMCHGFNHM